MAGDVDRPGFGDLLEREAEHRAVSAALQQVLGGSGVALAVVGPPGVGKTAVLQAAMAESSCRGASVLSARAVELEHDLSFGVVRQLLVPPLLRAGEEERRSLLEGPASLAGPVLGLAPPRPTGDPVAAALHGLYWLCANLTARGPVVMAVDDVHWADAASLRFLAYLGLRLGGLPVLLLVAARLAEPGVEERLLQRLLEDTMEVHPVRPLSQEATAEIVRRLLPEAASEAFCAACHELTAGNPFLVQELVLELRRGPRAQERLTESDLRHVAPATIGRRVLARLARLPPGASRLAQSVAIFPEGAMFRHLVALSGLDEASAAQAADELARMDILAPGRPLAFVHPLLRSAVHDALPEAARRRLHRQAALLLRAEGAAPEAVSTHLLATEPGTDPDAFGDLVAAAGGALAAGAPEAARRYLDRALEEPVTPAASARALYLRGLARVLSGDAAAPEDLRVAAETAGDPELRARALRDLSRTLAFGFQTHAAVEAMDEAMSAGEGVDDDLFARCVIDRIWILFSHDEIAPRYVEEMKKLVVPAEPDGPLHRAMAGYKAMWKAMSCEDADEAVRLARGALHGGHLAREGFDGLPPTVFAACALAYADHVGEAAAAMEDALAAQAATGAVMGLTYGHMIASMIRLYAGDLAEAESGLHLARDYSRGQLAGEQGDVGLSGLLAYVALERIGPGAADEVLAGLGFPPTWGGFIHHVARGRIDLVAGRNDAAFEHWRAALTAASARGFDNRLFPFAWSELALAAVFVGEGDLAITQTDEDLRRARRFGAPGLLGSALRAAGLVRGGEEGLCLLREAVSTLSRSSSRLLHAHALVDLGAALRRSNQRAAARQPLRLALDLARRCSADRLAATATEELRATGARVRHEFVTGLDALTPSERRIARMAAGGMTNREIAQQLFLTTKTVEMHMSHALGKLGVASRRQLPEALAAAESAVDAAPPSSG